MRPAFTPPENTNEALVRFNECMTYFMEMIVDLTGENIHAATAKMTLETFREQMLAWGNVGRDENWKEVVTFMVLSVETSRKVINDTSQTIRQSAQNSAAPALQAHVPQSSSVHVGGLSRQREEAAAGAVPSAVRRDPTESVRDASGISPGMHFNPVPHPSLSAPAAPRASMPQTKAPQPAATVPDYVVQAESRSAVAKEGPGTSCEVM